MGRGYQLVETPQVYGLIRESKYDDFSVAILSWLIEQLNIELMYQLTDVQIEIIPVASHGTVIGYPCLGIHYDYPDDSVNLEALVMATVDRIFQERSILELVTFISASGKDWRAITAKTMDWKTYRD